jgi:hypothetical protein
MQVPDKDNLYAVGTLTGPGRRNPLNTTQVTCNRATNECLTNSVDMIGAGHNYVQLGRLDSPAHIPVIKWDDYEIIAEEVPIFSCFKTTIFIDLKAPSLTWVEQPIHMDTTYCQRADTTTYRWRLEEPPRPWDPGYPQRK